MRLDTVINRLQSGRTNLRDLWSRARIFKMTHADVLKEKEKVFSRLGKLPRYANSELRGYDLALFEAHYSSLEFCHKLKGILYTTSKSDTGKPKTERLYSKKLGYYLSKHSDGGDFYYIGTDKPF